MDRAIFAAARDLLVLTLVPEALNHGGLCKGGAIVTPVRGLECDVGRPVMKRICVTAACVLALGASSGATQAADFPATPYSPAAPYSVTSAYSWIGPYVGGVVGYEWGEVSYNPTRPSGFTGGIEGGYNWQNGQFVFGGETDLDLSAANDTFAPWKFTNPWFGTLRARAGLALNNILFYGTAGLAYGGLQAQVAALSQSNTLVGWTVGAGMEVGFTPNWSGKVEYLYMNLGGTNYVLTGVTNGLQAGVLRFGVNYRF